MKIFFESFESFRRMFEPFVGKELEMVISGRKERVKLIHAGSEVEGTQVFEISYLDTGSATSVDISKVWEIRVP